MFGKRGAGGVGFGFTLIGLLLVVVTLGISAAVAVSTLGGTTAGRTSGTTTATTAGRTSGTTTATTAGNIGAISTQSTVVACESDAAAVETAIQEYSAVHGVAAAAVTPALVTSEPLALKSFPSSPNYTISIVSGVVMVATPKTSAPVAYGTSGACANAAS